MTIFETETCTRCGGSGHYSFCEMYGTTCFGCHGAGKKLTKRGRAARAWYDARREIPLTEVRPGMRVRASGATFTVASIDQNGGTWQVDGDGPHPYINVHSVSGKFVQSFCRWTDKVVRLLPKAENDTLIAEALAYQASLTKLGKVRHAR